jgi:hypothetical protein
MNWKGSGRMWPYFSLLFASGRVLLRARRSREWSLLIDNDPIVDMVCTTAQGKHAVSWVGWVYEFRFVLEEHYVFQVNVLFIS